MANGAVARRIAAEREDLKIALHRKLEERFGPDALSSMANGSARTAVREAIAKFLEEEPASAGIRARTGLVEEVLEEAFGLGPLEPLLNDPTLSDILVTTPRCVYVERDGKLLKTPVQFRDDAHLRRIIEKIALRIGRRIDESSPMMDGRLPDGSRVNAVIPPVAVDGPLLSIRRFRPDRLRAAELAANLTLTPEMLELLEACVKGRLNIVISGGAGAGKTTLLNVLSGFIPEEERIVTIEDAAELRLSQGHVARLEAQPASAGGQGAIRQRQLLVNALHMRPDRIIVGEVRGEEAFDMLQAMNTGHDGSLTTIHANTPRDAITRLEGMVSIATTATGLRSIRQQISSAIGLFVHLVRFSDGSRRVTHITECIGMEGDTVTLQDIFTFEKSGIGPNGKVIGRFRPTGIRPKFNERLAAFGLHIAPKVFQTAVEIR
jgi:pilus assembly protein CpaF